MANLNIVEFRDLALDNNNYPLPVGKQPAIAVQNKAFTTGTKSDQFSGATRFVQLLADAAADIDFGGADLPATPVRLQKLPANTVVYYGVDPGTYLSVKTS